MIGTALSRYDLKRAAEICSRFGDARVHAWNKAARHAEQLIVENWQLVERVAQALLARGELTDGEVRQIMQGESAWPP